MSDEDNITLSKEEFFEKYGHLSHNAKVRRIIGRAKRRQKTNFKEIDVDIIDQDEAIKIERIGKILSCYNRANTILCIGSAEVNFIDIANKLKIPLPTLSHIIVKLEQSQAVEIRKDSKYKTPSLTEFGKLVYDVIQSSREALREE